MKQSSLLQKLARVGVAALGAIAATSLAAPQKAEAGTAYGYSRLTITDLLLEDVPDGVTFGSETSDNATLDGLVCGNIDPTDAAKCHVTNNGVPMPPENFFGVWGNPSLLPDPPFNGTQGPNFARSDVLIDDPANLIVDGFDGQNVAEAFITGNRLQAEADAEWELVSTTFALEEDDEIEFTATYDYLLGVEITDWEPGDEKFAEAELAFNVELNGIRADGTVEGIRQFTFDESIGRFNENGFEFEQDSGSFDVEFEEITDEEVEEFVAFNIVVDAIEATSVSVDQGKKVPEPSAILGLLAVGGLGLGLKRKQQQA